MVKASNTPYVGIVLQKLSHPKKSFENLKMYMNVSGHIVPMKSTINPSKCGIQITIRED